MANSIFFGNGLNRISKGSKSWDELLSNITSGHVIKDIPYTLQYEDIYLANKINRIDIPAKLSKHTYEYKVKYCISEIVNKFSPNSIFERLASTQVESYITTNYDLTLEKQFEQNSFEENKNGSDISEQIYSIRRHHSFIDPSESRKNIWYIHGEAKYPKSIMLGYDHYCGAIGKIDSYIKGNYEYKNNNNEVIKIASITERLKNSDNNIYSWIDLFFIHNIHIIGFGMDYSEQDIWYILNKRQRYIQEHKADITNKIYFYGCIDDAKKELLNDFGIKVISYTKPQKKSEWTDLYERMISDLQNNLS